MYEATNAFVEFFKLSEANDNLAIENTQLKNRVVELENKLNSLTDTLNNVSWKNIRISPENEYAYHCKGYKKHHTSHPKLYNAQ